MTIELSHHSIDLSPMGAPSDIGANVRYVAAVKQVKLSERQLTTIADLATRSLSELGPQHPIAQAGRRAVADTASRLIDQLINIAAASAVMEIVEAVIEGNKNPVPGVAASRGRDMVPIFTGGADFFVWPDPQVTFEQHYGDLPWAPVTVSADDGSVTTVYLRNKILHRDPKEGPAFIRKGKFGERAVYWVDGKIHRDWREGPAIIDTDIEGESVLHLEYYEHDVLHRPSTEGPAVLQMHDGRAVYELFVENGKFHRDPAIGPALRHSGQAWARTEYYWEGQLHRPSEDGPASVETVAEGKGLHAEGYFTHGALHRPSHEGPALIGRYRDGTITFESYFENGKLHRDPSLGPARYSNTEEYGEEQEYCLEGKLHRDHSDGPALVTSVLDGKPCHGEEYYRHGVRHRPSAEGPAVLQCEPSGRILYELYVEDGQLSRDPKAGPAWFSIEEGRRNIQYRVDGLFHRDEEDGPALLKINDATGAILTEEYYRDGLYHRETGPAARTWHDNGAVAAEYWYRHSEPHRDGGPAVVEFGEDGSLSNESWYQNGLLHRDPANGPAVLYTSSDGPTHTAQYYVHGELVELPCSKLSEQEMCDA